MSATADVENKLGEMKPAKGQTVEEFAREGLRWQNEIYSANAMCDLGIEWETVTPADRKSWLEWANKKFEEARLPV